MEEQMKLPRLPRGLQYRGKNHSIIACFQWNGTTQKIAVGSLGVETIAECHAKRLEYMRAVNAGTYAPPKSLPVPTGAVTCADLWENYKRECETRERVPCMDRLILCWKHLSPVFGAREASAVRPRHIAAYVMKRREDGMTAGTINRELAALKSSFRAGALVELVPHVPVFPKKLRESQPRQGFITEEQYRLLASKCGQLWLRAFLALGFSYGMRKSEILNLRVRDVDLLENWLTVTHSKNGEARRVPLTAEVRDLLAACIQVSGQRILCSRMRTARGFRNRARTGMLCVLRVG
jgi:integrase